MLTTNHATPYCVSICDAASGLYVVAIDLSGEVELGLSEDRVLFTDSKAAESTLEKANQSYKACYILVPELQH